MDFQNFRHSYSIAKKYEKKVAYFCMEFGIDQALKIYSGGLGYLAGSHMRSAYTLGQQVVGIGMLWKFGYYDQVRKSSGEMDSQFRERKYNFLQQTDIKFSVPVNGHLVWVTAYYLAPEVFHTAPIFLLSTDLPENDHLAQTITHRLYDNNLEAKIAQYIILGKGGARLLEELNWEPDIYHLNEAHGLPALFHLYEKWENVETVRKHSIFTTHTPVPAGNEIHDLQLLERMGFFGSIPLEKVREISGMEAQSFNQTLVALRLAKKANGVSKMHGEVAREMWGSHEGICEIDHVTNSQNHLYWHDPALDTALQLGNTQAMKERKLTLKKNLFRTVADQTGKVFDPKVLTIVWARRFARYKRADLIIRDLERFTRLMENTEHPVQMIWAGKPYPMDYGAIDLFNELVHLARNYPNCAVLTGYQLHLSQALKKGADIWLNTPRVTREASGTSGMTAAMNGAVNVSTPDGWIPEFAKHGHNAFVIPPVDHKWAEPEQDDHDHQHLLDILEKEVLPLYYDQPEAWWQLVQNSMREVLPFFDSDRMADEYYTKMFLARVRKRALVP